jgi:hypothetical protein
VDPWEVVLEVQERPPSTRKMLMMAPLGGDVRDPGAPTINAKNVDGCPLGGSADGQGASIINA